MRVVNAFQRSACECLSAINQHGQRLSLPSNEKPSVGIQVALQKIEPSVAGLDLEVICSRPFWQAVDLVPPIDNLSNLDPIPLEAEPPRRFLGLVTGVTFNFNEK